MPNPYAQVAMTYLMRPLRQPLPGLMVGYWLVMTLVLTVAPNLPRGEIPFALWMPILCASALVVLHAKQQLASPRSQVVPCFRAPHVVVFVVMALSAVGAPMAIWAIRSGRPLEAAAVALCSLGFLLWWILKQNAWLTWPGMAVSFWLVTDSGQSAMGHFFSGQHSHLATLLALAGLAAFIAGVYRLAFLNEEMPDYHRGIRVGYAAQACGGQSGGAAPADGQRSRWRAFLSKRDDNWPVQLARFAGDGLWTRARRRQMTDPLRLRAWLFGLFVAVYFVFLNSVGLWHNKQLLATMAPWSIMFPLGFSVHIWLDGTRRMAYESLQPATRERFLCEFGLSMALSLLRNWTAVMLGIVLAAIVCLRGKLPLQALLQIVVFSALTQVFFFGVAAWLLRYKAGKLALAMGIMVTVIIPIMLLMMGSTRLMMGGNEHVDGIRPFLLPAAATLALLGLAILRDAYRRWLTTDLS